MSSPIIRCRPEPAYWILVVLLAPIGGSAIALAMFDPTFDLGGRWCCGISGSALLLPTLVCAVWLLRGQVVADQNGLRWRGLGRWRSASWAEVLDYYDKPFGRGSVQMVVETRDGTISRSIQSRSAAVESLRRVIEQNATSAAVRTWAVLGTRPEEPRSLLFEYRASDLRTMSIILWTCGLVWMGMMGFEFGPPRTLRMLETLVGLGWALGLLGGIAMIGFMLSLPAMMVPAALALRETQRRRQQRIRADAQGLIFEDGSRRLEAAWSDVMDYFVAPFPGVTAASRSVVVTRAGTFDFTPHLRDVAILWRMIAHYAKNAPCPEWRPRADEVLGGDARRWTRGPHGDRERVYHYRTRTNRALLWFPTVLAAMFALLPSLLRQASLDTAPDGEASRLAIVLGVATAWAWWRYLCASVRISGRGIVQITLSGRRFIPWSEVQDYRQWGEGTTVFGTVSGPGCRLWFWTGIAEVEELKEEIARRSINSHNRGWEPR